jgi:hypothetical protein
VAALAADTVLLHAAEQREPISPTPIRFEVGASRSPVGALFQDIAGQPVGGLRQPVGIRPQGIATVILRTGEMQRA